MKPCRKNRKLIAWLVMDALDTAEAAELARHFQTCEPCRRYREEISFVKQTVSSLELMPDLVDVKNWSYSHENRVSRAANQESPSPGLPFWRLALPALVIVVFGLLVYSELERQRVIAPAVPVQSGPATDLPPTLANYRAIANQSLDELDELLARQGQRPVPSPSARILASLNVPD